MRHFLIHSYKFVAYLLLATSLTVHGTEELDTVEIYGSRTEAYSPYDFIGSHQRLSAEEYNQSFNTLPSILQQQSGIAINSIGGIGQYSSPTIRGSSGQQVLVFWDGLLINSLTGGNADIGSLNLGLASNIDIYRSIAPAELSASAIGGVIHIQSEDLTKKTEAYSGNATITYGSYNTQQYAVSQHFEAENSHWLISTEYLSADNDYEYIQIGSVASPNTPISVPRYNNGSNQYNTLLKGQLNHDNSRMDLAIQYGQSNRELSTNINSPSNLSDISTKSGSAQVRWKQNWSNLHNSELLAGLSTHSQLYDDQFSTIGLGAQLNEYDTVSKKIQWNHYFSHKNISALISARTEIEDNDTDYQLLNDEELVTQCEAGRGCETTYERQQNDISGRLQYRNSTNQLVLQASRIDLTDRNLTTEESLKSFVGNTWSIAFEHKSKSGLTPFISIASQVRLPSTSELFGDRGTSVGNPELLPEEAEHFEIGFSYQYATFELDSSFYIRDLHNAIVGEEDSRGVIRYSNLGTTQHIGYEQDIIWNPIRSLILSVNLTIQSNEIIKDERFPTYKGSQVAGYSQLSSHISAQWLGDNWDFMVSNALEREGYYTNSNLLPKEDKTQWNASIGLNVNQWRFSFDANDITDNAARDYPSYPEPGRMYFLRANTKW